MIVEISNLSLSKEPCYNRISMDDHVYKNRMILFVISIEILDRYDFANLTNSFTSHYNNHLLH